ncbi:bis(5'-nucleosyl)-tetraphosphatase (symmetrical) YqeK [Lacticaseibacillus parakribbianus]|uniref:bis(5'-nucleosyl)-tetraphosphatase (symmetrical) YqeK n=1 Tax=Lacticaseibacillus parakribbianus TaxID=2970927 RepID=UPI0021CB38D2|nr:bis(5'-nucleosyl)-tetraphosphatase (symmetrical) YqeK [Lacticaseibacillus parakribbianus]
MTEITYPSTLTHGMSRAEILNHLQNRLDEPRYQHCLRVEQTARELAERFNADVDRAGLAGLLHDYAKQVPVSTYEETIVRNGFDPDLLNYNRGVWHGIVGTWFIETEVGITDKLVLQAISRHTTGDPEMTLLDEIIFVADFIEPARALPIEQKAREAAATDMTEATRIELENTLTYLIANRKVVYPKTLLTYNAFVTTRA